ncbi:MAG: SUMF1/EgtB/PvdO family nonheme iron enzyme [Terriglobia bacterium]
MGRIAILAILLSTGISSGWSQSQIDQQLKEAGVCARCHVLAVMEWGMSAHPKAGTDCVACHGSSRGHVADERDNVKPDRIPRGVAIAVLCATCHTAGCPKTKKTADCQTCHHVHALFDPNKPPSSKDERAGQLKLQWQSAARHVAEGERLVKAEQWEKARSEFQTALREQPDNQVAADFLKVCERRLQPGMPGFEIVSKGRDTRTGLPLEVRIAGLGTALVLVPGGAMDIGSDRLAAARPVHTVRVDPFYLGKFEVTQGEWKALMGSNPSAHQDEKLANRDQMPVEQVSWEDAQSFVRKLNERVAGGGFRLPTEAEWEFAARAGEPLSAEGLARVAWFNAPEQSFAPLPVGSKQPNKLGLFDMQGNVWEWCSSLYLPYPYDASDGRESPTAPGLRVLRGGGFADTADFLDPSFRHGVRPQQRLPWNGMRIARSVPANQPAP